MKKMLVVACFCVIVALASLPAVAAPQVVLDGSPVPVSPGVWQFNYIVKNYQSPQHINDLEVDASMCYGWIEMGCPNDWIVVMPITGPMARWVTEAAPVYAETEKSGFWVRAAVPTFYYGGAMFTYGPNHEVFATGTMALPVPEPTGLLTLGSGLFGAAVIALRKRR